MIGIQVLALLFALIQGYFTYLHFRRNEFTLRECLGWMVIWISFSLVTLFPQVFGAFADSAGAIRALDFFTVIGFIVVLSISFYTYVSVDRLRKKLEKAVRDLALQDTPAKSDKRR
ncbi:MAG TPA: DUF2304 domain-containing protein [Verrucomicrobiae bacterium]|nr:DUF2304 domain-containing protein [Verrucomicrobiae bacterium]